MTSVVPFDPKTIVVPPAPQVVSPSVSLQPTANLQAGLAATLSPTVDTSLDAKSTVAWARFAGEGRKPGTEIIFYQSHCLMVKNLDCMDNAIVIPLYYVGCCCSPWLVTTQPWCSCTFYCCVTQTPESASKSTGT